MIMPLTLVALASLATLSPEPTGVVAGLDGAPVSLAGVTVLVVDPADRDALQTALRAVRHQAHKAGLQPKQGALKALVIVIDLSDVPSFLHGFALDQLRDKVAEVQQRPVARAISLSWVADMDGSVSSQLRGPLEGSCFVVTDTRGGHERGLTVAQLNELVAARADGKEVAAR